MSKGMKGISNEDNHNFYTFNIKIISVKMKVKFHCRMKIQMDGEPITKQAHIADGSHFVFNEDYTLVQKQKSDEQFVLSLSLITSKGAKYIAAIAYLHYRQLARAADTGPSAKLLVNLSKCLDPDAVMEIVVKDSHRSGIRNSNSPLKQYSKIKKSRYPINSVIEFSQVGSKRVQNSPPNSPRGKPLEFLQSATRSQINFTGGFSKHHDQVEGIKRRSKSKNKRNSSQYLREKTMIYNSGISAIQNNFGVAYTQRDVWNDNVLENVAEQYKDYKESYSKLKEKLRKQQKHTQKEHQKRISLQASQATVKIQVLKYKLKCQQLEKNLGDKSINIKKLELRIEQLQRLLRGQSFEPQNITLTRNIHINSAKTLHNPQIIPVPTRMMLTSEGDQAISSLETKVLLANKQLEQLKNKMMKITRHSSQKQSSYVKQIEKKNYTIAKLQQQVANLAKNSSNISKNEQIFKVQIQSKNKTISQLEKEHEQYHKKISQTEKTNKILQKNLQELRNRTQQINKNLNTVNIEKQKIIQQLQSEKNKATFAQLSQSSLKATIEKLEGEVQAMNKVRQKHQQLILQHKQLQNQLKFQHKSNQNAIKQKQKSIQNTKIKYKQQIQLISKRAQDSENRAMQQQIKIKQLEGLISNLKSQSEILRRNCERVQRECDQYKNNERVNKKQYINFQSRIGLVNSQLQSWKSKFKSVQTVQKLQSQKHQNEIKRLKENLQQQVISQFSLKQKNQSMSSELSVLSGKYFVLEQKTTKQIKQLNQKLQNQTIKNNKLQQLLRKQEQINTQIRQKEKNLRSRVQTMGENQGQFQDLVRRYQHELGKIKTVLANTEQKLKKKQDQSESLSKQLKKQTQTCSKIEQKLSQITLVNRSLTSQLESSEKALNKAQIELESAKAALEAKQKQIEKIKISFDDESKNKIMLKQELIRMQAGSDNLSKEYEKFREHVYEVLIREFMGVDGLDSMGSFVLKNKDNNMTLKQSLRNTGQGMTNRKSPKHLLSGSPRNYTEQLKHSSSLQTLQFMQSQQLQQPLIHSISGFTLPQNMHANMNIGSLSNMDIIGIINQFSKQSKLLLSKMIEEYRLLEKQFQNCRDNAKNKENTLNQQIKSANIQNSKLQQQLSDLCNQKQGTQKHYSQLSHEMQQQITKLKMQLEHKKQQLDETIYTCNGLKIEKQSQEQYFQQKIASLTNTITKAQQFNITLTNKYDKVQENLSKLNIQLESVEMEKKKIKQESQSKQRKIKQLDNELNTFKKLYEDLNSKYKGTVAQVSELQVILSFEKEKSSKNAQIMSQEEKKLSETKQFTNSLIKQKQLMLKQQLQSSKKIIQLQSLISSLKLELDQTKQLLQTRNQQLQNQKQQLKRSNALFKDLETELVKSREENRKIAEDLKHKQRELGLSIQNFRSKQAAFVKDIHNKSRQLQEVISNKQLISKLASQQKQHLKSQISRLEQQNNRLQQQIRIINSALLAGRRQLQQQSKNVEQKSYEIHSYKQMHEKLSLMRQKQKAEMAELQNQLKQKEEQLFNATSQIYQWEQNYHQSLKKEKLEKERIQEELLNKYDNMCEDYQNRIEDLQKQKEYLKQKIAIIEQQNSKINQKNKRMQEEDSKSRTTLMQKIKKLQQDKSMHASNMRVENAKLLQLKQRVQKQLKKKQTQLQHYRSSQSSAKSLNQKLETKLNQVQQKYEQSQSSHHNTQQIIKTKQAYIKQFEQSVMNFQWAMEREVKKQLQNIVKFVINIEGETVQNKKKITDTVKESENRISRIVTDRVVVNTSATSNSGPISWRGKN